MKVLLLTVLLSIIMLNQVTAQQPVKTVTEVEKTTKTVKVKKTPLQKSSKLQPTKTTTKPLSVKVVKEGDPTLRKGVSLNSKKVVIPSSKKIDEMEEAKSLENKRLVTRQREGNLNSPIKSSYEFKSFATKEDKIAYYEAHPEEYERAKAARGHKKTFTKETYDQLPQERKDAIDANPEKYVVIDSSKPVQRTIPREKYNKLSKEKKKLVDTNPQRYKIVD